MTKFEGNKPKISLLGEKDNLLINPEYQEDKFKLKGFLKTENGLNLLSQLSENIPIFNTLIKTDQFS